MKSILTLVLILIGTLTHAQTCDELVAYAQSEDAYPDTFTAYGSSLVAKAEHYSVGNSRLTIVYLKDNDYDYSGDPYIYCGVSDYAWSQFKYATVDGSYGKSYHAYIRDNTCVCD